MNSVCFTVCQGKDEKKANVCDGFSCGVLKGLKGDNPSICAPSGAKYTCYCPDSDGKRFKYKLRFPSSSNPKATCSDDF